MAGLRPSIERAVAAVARQRFAGGLAPSTIVAVAVSFLLVLIPSPRRHHGGLALANGELALAAVLGLLLVVLALSAKRFPEFARLATPIGFIALAGLLRSAEGGAVSGFGGLFLLPVLWLALSANRIELVFGVLVMTLALVLPLTLQGAPDYPSSGWRGAVVLVTVAAVAGFTIQTLVAELQRRAVELEQANLKLADQNLLKEQFVSLAAHELRTPVTTIYGFAKTLNERSDQLSPEQQQTLRRELARQSSRMAALVEQLLDLSRLDADAIEIVPRRVNVREEVEELLPQLVGDRIGEVRVDVSADLCADIDTGVFERIVGNLITNALRYGEPPFVVHADEAEGSLRVVVDDYGPGIPQTFAPSLFERFSRSDDTRQLAGGTGLGLAIARSYARAHRGDLVYEPLTPNGSRFELVLPSASAGLQ